MKQASELRAEAREALQGLWGSSAVMVFVYEVLVSAVSVALGKVTHGSGSVLAAMALAPMAYALNIAFLRLLRKDPQDLSYLFQEFNSRVYVTTLLTMVYTLLWTLLLIIPGIIKAYSYSMTYYVLEDNPELSGDKAIEESMRMMSGHKWELFWLHLTFIGWGLLCILTLGIGFLWLVPYMDTAQAAFYENLKREDA
jgi:uncharacterized membrane protein